MKSENKIKKFLIERFRTDSDIDDLCRELGIINEFKSNTISQRITNILEHIEQEDPDYIKNIKTSLKALRPKFEQQIDTLFENVQQNHNDENDNRTTTNIDKKQRKKGFTSWLQINIKICVTFGGILAVIITIYTFVKDETDKIKTSHEEGKYKYEQKLLKYRKPLKLRGMVKIPAGEFTMGSDSTEDEKPPHKIALLSFYINEHEVTNREYKEYYDYKVKEGMETLAPRKWENGNCREGREDYPVTGIRWYDAMEYCYWNGKRLPNEAEWERAAKGNDDRKIAYLKPGEQIPDKLLTPNEEASYTLSKVKSIILPNPGNDLYDKNDFNVYDMSGNAWEWIDDWYDAYPNADKAITNEKYGKTYKVVRSVTTKTHSRTARTSDRNLSLPYSQHEMIGFRCVADKE
ncbi:MAG: SUMF1/EgtB/PvdO family nonheme iron enzyme [Candidatus Anammoxibacter sp.]